MFKGRNQGGGRGRTIANVVQKVPLNGLFTDAVWHCNCAPRVPATRFQTKNGGKNHGRWCMSLALLSTSSPHIPSTLTCG